MTDGFFAARGLACGSFPLQRSAGRRAVFSAVRALRCAAVGLPVLIALAFAAPQAVLAQINVELVGNTGQTQATDSSTAEREYAQAFTTGANATGYRLTGVDVVLDVSGTGNNPDLEVQIWSADATGNPNASVVALTGPGDGLGPGARRFDAPAGTVLDASTTYFVVLDLSAWNNRRLVKITSTASDDEDSGGAAGWTIADSGFYRTPAGGGGTWTDSGGNSYRIAIHGRAKETAPPVLSGVTVKGTTLALAYNEALDTGSAPDASAFDVTVDGTDNTVSSVAVAGYAVTLTLATEVTSGQVLVSYTKPATNPIRDLDGNEAAGFTGRTVVIDTTPPTIVAASVRGAIVTVTYSESLDPNATPRDATYGFTVDETFVSPLAAGWPGVAPGGTMIVVTLPTPVTSASQTVALVYNEGGQWRARDLHGNLTPHLSGSDAFPVTVVDIVAPALSGATVDGTRLTVAYDEPLDEGSIPASSAFSVTVASGTPAAPSSVAVTGSTVVLTLATAVTTGQAVTLDYTVPTDNPIQDAAANAAAALTGQPVTEASADATLSALSLTDASGTTLTLEPATFSSSTYAYSVRVANTVTSVKATVTKNHAAAALAATLVPYKLSSQAITITSGTEVTLTGLVNGPNVLTVTVTAGDGVTKQDYTLTVILLAPPLMALSGEQNRTVAVGVDLVLSGNGEDVDGGDVTAEWTAMTGGADVSSSVLSGFTATPVDTLGGDPYTVFTATFNAATPGTYTVRLTVTDDEDETAARSVTVTVPSPDAMLSALAVTDGSDNPQTLTPAFAAATTAYTVTNAIQAAKVTAMVNHAAATLAGSLSRDGAADEPVTMTSGMAATLSNLAVGANVLTITVTAENGATQNYTLTVTRTAAQDPTASISPSGTATVMTGENLTLTGSGADPDGGTVTYAWTVTDPSATDVTATVFAGGVDMATAVFATDDTTALGDYTVTLTVTDDEDATATATLTVTVTDISTDATLSALTVTGGGNPLTLSPAFAPATMDYDVTLASGDAVTSVDVTATVNHMAATLAGSLTRAGGTAQEVALTSGAARTLADLPPGDSVLRITATAEDAATTQTYTLTIMRKVPPTVSIAPAGDQRVAPETDLMLTATGEDPDGGAVTYAWAAAADPGNREGTAAAVLSGANTATLTFNAADPGAWRVTVTVTDDESQTARASLTVTVAMDTEMRAKAVTKVLAAAGVRTLSSVLDNVGARLGGAPGPSLTLAGENVPLGAASSSGLACEPDVFGRNECAPDMRGASALDLFRSSAFSLAAGAAGEAMAESDAPRWAVWGRGDAGAFEGSPDGMSYDGKTLTGWLGADARAGRWVAGVALSRGETEVDYEFDAGGGATGAGSLETTLTSVYPYGRWTFDEGYEVRGIVGMGTGEARHRSKEEGAAEETSDLTMWMASAGVRRPLPPTAGISLAARGEVSLVQMETGDGEETIDGLSAQGWRGRASVEGSGRHLLPNGGLLEPFAEAGLRQDGGDGLEGSGVELAGGVRYNVKRLHVEVRGRWLAAHTEEGAKEQGVSATVRMDADALRRGFSFALTPRWGSSASGSGALWKDDLPQPAAAAAETSVDARLGYGVGMPRGALLTPFAETGLAEHRQYRVGARYEAQRALSLELSGERRESATAEPEHAFGLDLRLRF